MAEVRLRGQEVGAGSGWPQGTGREAGRWGSSRPVSSPCAVPPGAEQATGGGCGAPGGPGGAGWALASSGRYIGARRCGGSGCARGPGPSRPPLSTGLRPGQMPRVAPVRTPRLQAEPRVTLPLDINNYPMAKFVRCHFKVRAGRGPVRAGTVLRLGLAPGHPLWDQG